MKALLLALLPGADANDDEAIARMQLERPVGFGERLQARLLRHALARGAG